jgi:hypothetical protein
LIWFAVHHGGLLHLFWFAWMIDFDPSGVPVCCCLLIRFSANVADLPRAAGK